MEEQTLIVCLPAQSTQLPCPGGSAPAVIKGYVLTAQQMALITAAIEPFDYSAAAAVWGLAFTFVVGLYLVSKSAGIILNRIKS